MTSFVHALLDRTAAQAAEAPAVSDRDGLWTYRELRRHSAALSRWLVNEGVTPGDRIVTCMRPSREFAALLFAASYARACLAPLSPETRRFQLEPLLSQVEPRLIIADRTYGRDRGDRCVPTRHLPALDDLCDGEIIRWTGDDPTRTALLMFTSGSMALPRAVRCPHRSVVFATEAIVQRLGYHCGDVVLCCLPMSFDYGLYQILLATAAGAHLHLVGTGEASTLPRLLARWRPTVVPIVPPLADTFIAVARRRKSAIEHVRLFTNTGAELPARSARRLRQHYPGSRVVLMYGMTECKRATIADPDEDLRFPGSSGVALPGTAVSIEAAGVQVPHGVVGEVVVRGPHVMAGYWDGNDAAGISFQRDVDGGRRLNTGDYGWQDVDGRLYLLGRRDGVFQQGGVRVATLEIERAALDVPGIRQAGVLPPTSQRSAVLVLACSLDPFQALRELSRRLEPSKTPHDCRCLPNLPTTSRGKVDVVRLTELMYGRTAPGAGSAIHLAGPPGRTSPATGGPHSPDG